MLLFVPAPACTKGLFRHLPGCGAGGRHRDRQRRRQVCDGRAGESGSRAGAGESGSRAGAGGDGTWRTERGSAVCDLGGRREHQRETSGRGPAGALLKV